MNLHFFLQSKEWSDFQKKLGRAVFEYDADGIKAKIIKHPLPFNKSYLYIPHGPRIDFNSMVGGIDDPIRNFIGWLKKTAKQEKAIFIKSEPATDNVAQALAKTGFVKSNKRIQPAKSVVIDLKKSHEELLNEMHHKTRYNIKVAEKHDIKVKIDNDIEIFWQLIKKTTTRDRFSSHPKSYYQKLLEIQGGTMYVKLFLAYLGDLPVAGAIVLFSGDTSYYLHGASDYNYRKYMAPYLLHWAIIQHAILQMFSRYDLWGIDANIWPGVTRFKLGWGGRVIEYPGAFDLITEKMWYWTYLLAKKIF